MSLQYKLQVKLKDGGGRARLQSVPRLCCQSEDTGRAPRFRPEHLAAGDGPGELGGGEAGSPEQSAQRPQAPPRAFSRDSEPALGSVVLVENAPRPADEAPPGQSSLWIFCTKQAGLITGKFGEQITHELRKRHSPLK